MGYRLGDTGDRRRQVSKRKSSRRSWAVGTGAGGWRPGDRLLLAGCVAVLVIALWLAWDAMRVSG